MPCRDYYDDVRIVDNTQTFKEHRDKLARIACAALTMLETMGISADKVSSEAAQWFPEHKEADRKRIEKERKEVREEAERKRAAREKKRTDEIAQLKRLQAKYGKDHL